MRTVLSRLRAAVSGIPRRILVLTGTASAAAIAFGVVQGWPAWGYALAVVLLWAPILLLETSWTHRHYGGLALFYLLVVTQSGHVIEHVAQVTQIHVLGVPAPDAHGIFGALDIEWVHVTWNSWVLVAALVLLFRFPRNWWLLAAAVIAGWHEIEHLYIISRYIATGVEGNPGLLAQGGVIGGGLPISRPDLHFFYNVIETTPLIAGFVHQLRRSHDDWLAKAFPYLPEGLLVRATDLARTVQAQAGKTIVHEGDLPRAFYVVSRGEVEVLRQTAVGEQRVATLEPGQFFGEVGLLRNQPRTASVRAKTPAELLALDRRSFDELLRSSEDLAAEVERITSERQGPT